MMRFEWNWVKNNFDFHDYGIPCNIDKWNENSMFAIFCKGDFAEKLMFDFLLVKVRNEDKDNGLELFEACDSEFVEFSRILKEMQSSVESWKDHEETVHAVGEWMYCVDARRWFGLTTSGYCDNLSNMKIEVFSPKMIYLQKYMMYSMCVDVQYRGRTDDKTSLRLGSGRTKEEAFEKSKKEMERLLRTVEMLEKYLFIKCVVNGYGMDKLTTSE